MRKQLKLGPNILMLFLMKKILPLTFVCPNIIFSLELFAVSFGDTGVLPCIIDGCHQHKNRRTGPKPALKPSELVFGEETVLFYTLL